MQDHPACLVAHLMKDDSPHTTVTDQLYHVRFLWTHMHGHCVAAPAEGCHLMSRPGTA